MQHPPFSIAHYNVTALIGKGGMGAVYRATDVKLGREVALKMLPAEVASDADRLARFQREARAVAALNHPNIVTLYSVEEWNGVHFLTMEFVEGASLEKLIPSAGLPAERILDIAESIAQALVAAHGKGLAHRDLKPANVMIANDGRVKVLDFGLAKDVRKPEHTGDTETMLGQTQEGVTMGTPPYMSPEQILGSEVDHRTDLFSLGIMLIEMATGRRPFQGATSMEIAASILRDDPLPLAATKSGLPGELLELIRQCLEKDASRRIQTARQVTEQLGEARRQLLPAIDGARTPTARVAVVPFKFRGPDPSLESLAEGLTDEINAGLSRFSYLQVVAKANPAAARYLIEGNIRQAGSRLRVTVQLSDNTTGAHLWAETYERGFSADAIFEIQDDLVPRIVSTCADPYGVLPRSISDSVRGTDPRRWSPHEALMRFFGYHQRLTPADHLEAREGLERAVEMAPRNADCWAVLSIVYAHEHGHGFNPLPNPLERALAAARRAVDLSPSNHLAHQALSTALLFRKEFAACLHEADRAIEFNPLDGGCNAAMGANIAFAGNWERGCALIARSMELNPQHPVWYRGMFSLNEYRKANYRAAVDEVARINAPDVFWLQMILAAANARLGEREAAAAAVRALNALAPNFSKQAMAILSAWIGTEFAETFIEDLRKAGMSIDGGSKDIRATSPSIAVLPFANLSADKDQEYFSDGLAEEIINLLAQVSGLKVIARTSSFAFRGKEDDVRRIAAALDVTHVLEGSVRRAGDRIRITAQLITAADGSHLWSERYDRELNDVFAVQDEIAGAISQALRGRLLPSTARQRYAPKLPAYEAFLKAKYYEAKVTPESGELSRRSYESSLALDPGFALAHVGLAYYWTNQMIFGRRSPHEVVLASRAAVGRALEIDSLLPEAHALLGLLAALYDLDWDAAEHHFDFPMARQAGSPLIRPMYGLFQFLRGNAAQAIEPAERSIEEDPLEVWPRMNLHSYLQAVGRDREAFEQIRKVLELDPNLVVARVSMAHFHADWGQFPEALAQARKVYDVGPWYPDGRATLAALLLNSGEEKEASALYASIGDGQNYGECRSQSLFYMLCGDLEKAADWAEKAITERDCSMMHYLRFVVARKLRASRRWPGLAKMLNLPAAGRE